MSAGRLSLLSSCQYVCITEFAILHICSGVCFFDERNGGANLVRHMGQLFPFCDLPKLVNIHVEQNVCPHFVTTRFLAPIRLRHIGHSSFSLGSFFSLGVCVANVRFPVRFPVPVPVPVPLFVVYGLIWVSPTT